jgi:hypothetical protein
MASGCWPVDLESEPRPVMQCKDDTMTPEQINWLTWGAVQHRPHGAPRWDEPGTRAAIVEHCGSWGIDIATQHVLAHARDAKAKTPFVIKGKAPHNEPTSAARQPAKPGGDECPMHPGEYAAACRSCAADRLAGDESTRPQRQKAPADVAHRGAGACRAALGLTPDPSPAPDAATSEPAVDDGPPSPAGVQQRAGESDRPETGAAPGCYRPTTDGICDRCRAAAAAEDLQAANAELVERLHANEAERARNRPPVDPAPPRYFTSADYDPEKVHAAQAQAAADRSNA